jgi:ribulose-bisphosphate carboxylase small chain
MRLTQGTFSFLPDLTDKQIAAQVNYCIDQGWSVALEYTDDPHPRNTFWEMYGAPMFDLADAAGFMQELAECRKTFAQYYIRVTGFDSTHGVESIKLAFIVNRPAHEPGFRLVRQEEPGRTVRYTVESYAVAAGPEGSRY